MPPSDMESTGLVLMSIIRVLNDSHNDEERDLIKKKLEDLLTVSDKKLTDLVAKNSEELKQVMQIYTGISDNLQTSSIKLARAKKRLTECREMLTFRLEELNRLSEASEVNEKVIALLDEVDELLTVPARISELLNNREYLGATQLLVDKQKCIDERFYSFECLKEVRSELDAKREEVYRILKEKLFTVENDSLKNDIVESLKLIDKTPDLPDLELPKEKAITQEAKPSLFKFSLSSHAICFNEHYKEQIEVTKTLLSK